METTDLENARENVAINNDAFVLGRNMRRVIETHVIVNLTHDLKQVTI